VNWLIGHLQTHVLGLAHVLAALAALCLGSAVLFSRKGTRRHRHIGRAYFVMMLALNGTALFDYELYGRFGPFHWMALASLITVVAGYSAAKRRMAGWQYRHAYFMAGSFVGLVAAAVAEVISRVPGWPFGASVAISSFAVIALGIWIMLRRIPPIIDRPRSRAG
jgi:uncharacterized membrane protein